MANEDKNANLANHFRIEIDGMDVGAFEECEVEGRSYEIIENRTGTDANHSLPCAGLDNGQKVTIRKVARDVDIGVLAFFAAWNAAKDTDRKGGMIQHCKRDGTVFFTETWVDGICPSFTSPSLNANANDKSLFVAEIACPKTED